MLVIEGKNNKSKILENWIRKEYMGNKMVIFDKYNIPAFNFIDNVVHYIVDVPIQELIEEIKSGKDDTFIKRYDWLAFHVNISKDELELFQELDRSITQNIIVTVQNNNQGLTSKYFL